MTRYAVDLDGTLADTVGATLEIFNERYGTRYTKADVDQWHFWDTFPELQMVPESKRKDIILRIMDEAWISGRVKPEPGAAAFMVNLYAREPQTDIVTGRSAGTPSETIEHWLAANGIPYRALVRTRGGQEKVYHGYDVYVDDDPNLAQDIDSRWPDKRMYLVEQPWNQETILTSGRVKRVRSLHGIWLKGTGAQQRLFRHPSSSILVHRYRRRLRLK